MENLGKLTELTAGNVDRVTPIEITKNFQSILSDPVIATHVTATITLHKGLEMREDDVEKLEKQAKESTSSSTTSDKKTSSKKDIGNVTKETGITFQYGTIVLLKCCTKFN